MARNGPPKEKPKKITIHVVKRTRRFIFIAYDRGDEVQTVQSRDNPLPSFLKALDAIAPLVSTVCHLPKEYCATDLRLHGIKLDTKGGARTVSIIAQKSLDDAGKALKLVTPPRLLENPTEEGSYTPPLLPADRELIDTLVNEAKAYVLGERAQGQLPLDGDDDDDEDGEPESQDKTAPLPFVPDAGTAGKPARKQKPAAK